VRRRVGLPDWRHFFENWRWNSEHGAALLLAVSALATAWSSYQASVWGGVQATQYNQSSVLRAKAVVASEEAARLRMFDVLLFTKWLEAYAGQRANEISDRYVFATVILATVLFFAGAVRPLVSEPFRGFVLLIATLLCLTVLARLVTTPLAR
jgi:hypothetical protein